MCLRGQAQLVVLGRRREKENCFASRPPRSGGGALRANLFLHAERLLFNAAPGPRLVLQDGEDIFSHLNLNSCELCIIRKIRFPAKLFIENMQKVKHADRFLIQKYKLSLVMIKTMIYFVEAYLLSANVGKQIRFFRKICLFFFSFLFVKETKKIENNLFESNCDGQVLHFLAKK